MFSSELIKIIKTDKIAVIPTDTLYGIVGDAFSKKTIDRIYSVKGRDENKPFIILISSVKDLNKFGIKLSDSEKKFLDKIWPNSISVILSCKSKKFEYLHRGTKSLAFRLPKSKKMRDFLKKTGPIVAPSANPQGLSPARTIKEAKSYFGNSIDLYVSGKTSNKPSTIILFIENKIKILRQGAVFLERLLR